MPCLVILILCLAQVQSAPPPQGPVTAVSPVKGSIEMVNGHRIVNLWGTHYDMGYAHGYLLGDEIMQMLEDYGLGVLTTPTDYQTVLLPMVQYAFYAKPEYMQELRGMFRGMKDSGTDLFIEDLGRDLILDDLLTMNLIPDLSRYGCSAVFGWGDATAADPVLAGGSAMARDLDWGQDPTGLLNTHGVIFVFQAADPEQRAQLRAVLGHRGATDAQIERTRTLLKELGGIEQTRALAHEYVEEALRDLDGVPSSTYKDLLCKWAEFVIERRF